MDPAGFAATIDQTLLSPTAGFGEGSAWIGRHARSGFAALCVSPFLAPVAAQHLSDTGTAVCSVAGFPLGYTNTESKAEEAAHLVELGCDEIDMVMNVAAFLEGEHDFVREDVSALVETVRARSGGKALVKVILETGYLEPDDIARACGIAVDAGAGFVKTSTGFGPRGASVEDVRIMREAVGPDVGVKAAGGIRDLTTALAMLDAGADRLGASAGAELVEAFRRRHA